MPTATLIFAADATPGNASNPSTGSSRVRRRIKRASFRRDQAVGTSSASHDAGSSVVRPENDHAAVPAGSGGAHVARAAGADAVEHRGGEALVAADGQRVAVGGGSERL